MIAKRTLLVWLTLALVGCVAFVCWAGHMAYSDTPYDATKAQLMTLEMKIRAFHLDTHSLPRTLKDLVVQADVNNWRGPYAKEREIFDVWGHPIGYEVIDPAKPKFRLFTAGPKGVLSKTYEP